MSELLLNDENLTTADIAHPEKTTVAQPSAIDDRNLQPGQAVPAPLTAGRPPRYFRTTNCIIFARAGIRFRPHSSMSLGRQ